MSVPSTHSAAFVQRFFALLEREEVAAAALHGWQGGFEGELSDVDFVIESRGFDRIAALVYAHCQAEGWMLCQVLRHETTAAYCVCASIDDPQQAVALDACSDYRRNECILIPATDLLSERVPLISGGFRISDAMGLRYRFAKAAVKSKDPRASAIEFDAYPLALRASCETWLTARWYLVIPSWDAAGLDTVMQQIRTQSNSRPPLQQLKSMLRILTRITRPTGMLLIVGTHADPNLVAGIEERFGRLEFRRTTTAARWTPKILWHLIRSTLVVMPRLSPLVAALVARNRVFNLDPSWDLNTSIKRVSQSLHARCKHEYRLG